MVERVSSRGLGVQPLDAKISYTHAHRKKLKIIIDMLEFSTLLIQDLLFSVMINTKWHSMARTTTEDCFSIRMFDCYIREHQFSSGQGSYSPTLKYPLYLMFTTKGGSVAFLWNDFFQYNCINRKVSSFNGASKNSRDFQKPQKPPLFTPYVCTLQGVRVVVPVKQLKILD